MAEGAPNQAPHCTNKQMQLKETKHGKVCVGELSPEFLRIQAPNNPTLYYAAVAQQMALQQQMMPQGVAMSTTNKLVITLIEAKLNKNYGITKMNPYCRARVGHSVYETAAAQSAGKLPYWGQTMSVSVPDGIEHIDIEILDSRSFSENRIGWGQIAISESLKKGKAEDDWWPLSGKLGDKKEGMIHVQLSWRKVQRPMYYSAPMPMMMPQGYVIPPPLMGAVPPGAQMGAVPAMPQQQLQPPVITEEDLKQVKEMFPDTDDDVIKSVLEASRGNKDAAINSLLSMQC